MQDTAEIDSAVCRTPQKNIMQCVIYRRNRLCIVLYTAEKTLHCVTHRRIRLCTVLYTAETDFALCYTPQKHSLHWFIHRRIKLCTVLYTAETDSVLYYTPQKQILHCVIHRRNSLCIELYTAEKYSAMCFKPHTKICNMQDTAETDSAVCRTPQKQALWWAGHRWVRMETCKLFAQSNNTIIVDNRDDLSYLWCLGSYIFAKACSCYFSRKTCRDVYCIVCRVEHYPGGPAQITFHCTPLML